MLIKFRGDLFVSVCWLGLTVLAVVVVEMQGEISRQWEIWWRSCTASPTYNQNSVEG